MKLKVKINSLNLQNLKDGLHYSLTYDNKVIFSKVRVASSFYSRFVGLLNTKKIEHGEGLLITPCSSIHTFFMKYPIDVVFLDKQGLILEIMPDLVPWKISVPKSQDAFCVFETKAGGLKMSDLRPGKKINLMR